jgi:NADH-quinone oxidoreductase subunit M
MMLSALILVPLLSGLLAWLLGQRRDTLARWIALAGMLIDLVLAIALAVAGAPRGTGLALGSRGGAWWIEEHGRWIPSLGISYHLGLDGLSLLLVLLTAFIGVIAVLVSWREVHDRVGLFHGMLLWVLAGIQGVFLSLDLFLFYFFWEVMLVPMYFLIGVWGHERRIYAAVKFFLFTLAGGLLMLVSIIGVVVAHGRATGTYTFDYPALLGTAVSPALAMGLLLGFVAGFAVKLPAVPLHSWLPDAHTEAPTAGSVILAGLLLKTGAYGLIRFAVPLLPEAAARLAPIAMVVGVIGILYGAVVAFAQTDLKRLVAYTSVSHMGFVLLGIFAWNEIALQGVVLQMVAHALSTGALFVLVGMLQERLHTRDLSGMGGLWEAMPRMGGIATVLAMASLGLPGLANFVAEFLVLLGVYPRSIGLAALGAIGMVLAAIYSLRVVQGVFHGPRAPSLKLPDLSARETIVLAAMVALLIVLGFWPQPLLDATRPLFALTGMGGTL